MNNSQKESEIKIGSSIFDSIVNSSDVAESLARSDEQEDPSDQDSFIKLGKDAELKKHKAKALKLYEQAINASPTSIEPYRLKALCLCKQGQLKEAINFINQKINENFYVVDMICIKAQCYYQCHNKEKALQLLEIALKKKKDHFESLILKSQCLLDLNDIENSLSLVQHVSSIFPNHSKVLEMFGKIKEHQKQYKEAIEFYTKALSPKVYNKNDIYFHIGLCYQQMKEFKKAIETYEIITKYESLSDVYLNIGKCYLELHQSKKAITNFDLCLVLSPLNEEALQYQIKACKNVNDIDKISQCYNKLITLEPNCIEGHIFLARYYLHHNNISEAFIYINKSKELIDKLDNQNVKEIYISTIKSLEEEIDNQKEKKSCQCSAVCIIY